MLNLTDKMPIITIITPSLNRAEFIEEAIKSVLNQGYPHIEHLIMDGGSTDSTIDVLAQYSHLRVVIEPDEGLYDAMNKGIMLANGEILGFLNTDDFYEPNVFQSVIKQFQMDLETSAVVGNARVFIDDPSKGRRTYTTDPAIHPGELLYRSTRGASIFNAWFFRKSIFNRLGVFNTHYQYSADRDFLIRMALCNTTYADIPNLLYHYRSHLGSLTFQLKDYSETDMMIELLALNENYLNTLDVNDPARKMFLVWHSQITSDHAITALKRRALDRAIAYLRLGKKYNPAWSLIFVERLVYRGVGFVRRRINSNFVAK